MKNVLFLTIYLLIISGTAFAVESTTYFGAAGAYYFDDNKGFGLRDGDFAPVSYSPKKAPTDADRALGAAGVVQRQRLLLPTK